MNSYMFTFTFTFYHNQSLFTFLQVTPGQVRP